MQMRAKKVRCRRSRIAIMAGALALVSLAAPAIDLSQIGVYSDPDKPAAERIERLLDLLQEEDRSPVEPSVGWGGGRIDHDYTMAQLALALSLVAHDDESGQQTLRQAASRASSPDVREAMGIALGLSGDATVAGDLVSLLKKPDRPHRRALAASALGACHAVLCIPDLAEALRDTHSIRGAGDIGPENREEFPVRRAASLALRQLGVTVQRPNPDEFDYRIDPASAVAAIEPLLHGSENAVSAQAIRAVGRIGGEAAGATLRRFVADCEKDAGKRDLVDAANAVLSTLAGRASDIAPILVEPSAE